jgi:hypothetical protein
LPDGLTHYKYFKLGYWVEIPLSLILVSLDWRLAVGNIAGYSFHRWCDNDLDLMGTSACEGRMVNELPLLGHLMFGVSSAYGSIFRKTHRKPISHAPFLSTAIRLLFMFFVPFVVGDSWGINFIVDGWWKLWFGFYIGLSQADSIHYYLDLTYGN